MAGRGGDDDLHNGTPSELDVHTTLGVDAVSFRPHFCKAGAMADTSSRMLQLLSLLQTGRDWTGTELAERLAVGARTVRRDVERLRRLGYPAETRPGPGGFYRLRAGTAMPPLILPDDEAIAVAASLRMTERALGEGVAGSPTATVPNRSVGV